MDMNKILLIGRIVKDLELKESKTICFSNFTLAVNRMEKDVADFISCVAFGKTAENMAKYLGKGRQVAIEGHLQVDKWNKEDGTTAFITKVVVERFYFISNSGSNNIKIEYNNNNKDIPSDYFGGGNGDMTLVDDGEDMPF